MPVRIWVSLAILAAALGCGARKDSQPEPLRWIRVAFPEVKHQPESYPLSGTVVPQRAAQSLSFLVPGRVVAVGPREGEGIKRGQVLASLETTSYAAGLDAAAAQTRSAQAAAARAQDEFQRMKIFHDRQRLGQQAEHRHERRKREGAAPDHGFPSAGSGRAGSFPPASNHAINIPKHSMMKIPALLMTIWIGNEVP